MTHLKWFALTIALTSLAIALGALSPRPSDVAPMDADARVFSGERAAAVLARLLGDQRAHPTGSAANVAVRQRLEGELTRLGLTPRVQRATSCGQYGICGVVENVIAELPGSSPGPAVALASHYDSVPAGPGAADDGAGVAAMLEIARAVRAGGKLTRPLILIFTDGEEMGLLGARALVKDRELLARLGAVINVEARGVSGPSLMFETSTPNDGLIAAFAGAVSRPVSSSAFYAVYKQLPNDTDLSVFRRAGVAGLNFAFIGGTAHYHTPSDDLAHLSRASLQHQGEQALAIVRELGSSPELPKLEHETVFFDCFGRTLISMSVLWFRVLSFFVVVAGGALWLLSSRTDAQRRRAAGFALLACVTALVVAAGSAVLLDVALRVRGSLDQPWPANASWIFVAAEAAALLGLCTSATLLGRRFDREAGFLGFWAFELLLTALTATLAPEAGYLFLLPATAATLLALLWYWRGERALGLAMAGVAVVQALVWAPIVGLAFDALGVALPSLNAALGVLVGLPLLSLFAALAPTARKRSTAVAGFLFLVFGAVAIAGDARSPEAPARVSIAHQVDLDTGRARWLLEAARVPPELARVAHFASNSSDDFPWFGGGLVARFEAPADAIDPAVSRLSPSAELISNTQVDGGRELELSFRAGAEDALALNVALPSARSKAIYVDGESATPVVVGGHAVIGFLSPGRRTVRVRWRVQRDEPLMLTIAECVSGLPESGRPLARLRNGPSSASQTGDLTIVSRKLRF